MLNFKNQNEKLLHRIKEMEQAETLSDNGFILLDRVVKIQSVINQIGEENFYVSYSGGKDSNVLSVLLDLALPNNKIPRVYARTGLDLKELERFVKEQEEKDPRFCEIAPSVKIKEFLDKNGYPFKSKAHSHWVERYQRAGMLPSIEHYLGISGNYGTQQQCPKKLRYQFTEDNNLKISDKCCVAMKEEPLRKWGLEHSREYTMIGVRKAEGGRRKYSVCFNKQAKKFQPLVPLTDEWLEWFINLFDISPPNVYKQGIERTGCVGCPFSYHLNEELSFLASHEEYISERRKAERIWEPVYKEYRRLGYRLKEDSCKGQMNIFQL